MKAKQILALLLSVLMLAVMMAGCAGAGTESPAPTVAPKAQTPRESGKRSAPVAVTPEDYGNENLRMIADYIKSSGEVPEAYTKPTAEEIRGTVEAVTYTTRAYAYEEHFGVELEPVEKTMYVYLPHGYTEEKDYPTLYLVHGGSEVAEYWFSIESETEDEGPVGEGYLIRLLDNMIDQGVMEPMIVVSPGLYVDTQGYHAYAEGGLNRRHPDSTEKNDPETLLVSIDTAWTDNFINELRNDIIPLIDSRYATAADRMHRAIGGTSMGSMTTLRSGLWLGNDLFAWYIPMSSGVTASRSDKEIQAETEMVWDALTEGGADPEIAIILNFNGSKDMAHDAHVTCMNHLLEYADGKLVNGVNYCFFDIDGFDHNFNAWRYDMFLALQILFK